MLDGQAPDIQVIANGQDDIDDEAAVHANSESQTAEQEGDLVHIVTERGRPAKSEMRQGEDV